ncbi:acylphosphatase [Geotalea daltonii FRC-32]|uniref:Acylphosphatase n=1 Tax=Geotalea daltonii (strain DSM 22248 / JCM 15807 / FRC-32) TaxID=316067 RepID=B9M860_GEODF|nr:acylphosphatase [Geotalea daltonii]ACM20326.1 acylphosphatase [Geotalea daltonii FRC-32]
MKIRAMVTITGLVQGVAFRQSTQQTAQRLNVCGWVKNLPDGSVQGCFEGEETDVETLIGWCHEGPSRAEVSGVNVKKEPFSGQFESFRISY